MYRENLFDREEILKLFDVPFISAPLVSFCEVILANFSSPV